MKRISRAKRYRRRRKILYGILILITAGVVGIILNFEKIQNEYDWLTLRPEQKLNVPLERQLPDLPNGCEVTSLSMLLNYYDINVSKLELSSNIKHVSSFIGNDFVRVLKLVSKGHPVMIITTLKYDRVNDMRTWQTKQGKVNVTPSSHACVVTGYNKKKGIVYVNDPYGVKDKKVSLKKIEASYNQQGKQALYVE